MEDKFPCKYCGLMRTGQDSHFYPTDCFEYAKRRLIDCEASCKNLEEYVEKGVAFRDELQARVALLEKVVEAAIVGPCRHTSDYNGTDCPLCAALDAAKEG
jgi:hypothetical protein